MRFIRSVDERQSFPTGNPRQRAQILSNNESATFFVSWVEAGGSAAGLHYHARDQLYFLYDGGLTVRLDDEIQQVDGEAFVYVPAGVPHRNWNPTNAPETHLEVIVPALSPVGPLSVSVENSGDVPDEVRSSKVPCVTRIDRSRLVPLMPGVHYQTLLDADSGSDSAQVYYVETDAQAGRKHLHVHDIDQYYFVISGELTVDLGLQQHVVGARTLAMLPAGVPHRVWNAGPELERHLAFDTPGPARGRPWARQVNLEELADVAGAHP